MKNLKFIYFLTSFLLICSCSKELEDDASKDLKKIPQNVSVPKKSNKSKPNTSKLNSVCNCYKEALETLDGILDVRSAYDTFDEYNKVAVSAEITKLLVPTPPARVQALDANNDGDFDEYYNHPVYFVNNLLMLL